MDDCCGVLSFDEWAFCGGLCFLLFGFLSSRKEDCEDSSESEYDDESSSSIEPVVRDLFLYFVTLFSEVCFLRAVVYEVNPGPLSWASFSACSCCGGCCLRLGTSWLSESDESELHSSDRLIVCFCFFGFNFLLRCSFFSRSARCCNNDLGRFGGCAIFRGFALGRFLLAAFWVGLGGASQLLSLSVLLMAIGDGIGSTSLVASLLLHLL